MFWLGIDIRWAYINLIPFIYQQTRCKQSALDILHDSFLKYALQKNLHNIDQPHAYLRTIIRSILADNQKIKNTFLPIDAELIESMDLLDYHPLWGGSYAPSPEHIADIQQRLQQLETIITGLPNKCREVFWLYRVEGISQKEIASKLNISLKMVEGHMARAMMELSKMWDVFFE